MKKVVAAGEITHVKGADGKPVPIGKVEWSMTMTKPSPPIEAYEEEKTPADDDLLKGMRIKP